MKSNVSDSPHWPCFSARACGGVLAHQLDAGGRQRAHQLGRDVLGRRQQLDLAGVAPRALAGAVDAIPHRREVRAHAPGLEVG